MEIVYVLAILLAFAMIVGFSVVTALVMLELVRRIKPKGSSTRSDKFAADAERLHRLTHPEDDER